MASLCNSLTDHLRPVLVPTHMLMFVQIILKRPVYKLSLNI